MRNALKALFSLVVSSISLAGCGVGITFGGNACDGADMSDTSDCVCETSDTATDTCESGEDNVVVLSNVDDLDQDGVTDFGNEAYAFGTHPVFGASFVVMLGTGLPSGAATGVSMSMRGFGSEQYSNANNGWAENFMPMPEAKNSAGQVIGYGVGGLRDGDYEFNCARTDAAIGALDGWCKIHDYISLMPKTHSEFMQPIENGTGDCERTDWVFSISVQGGRIYPTYSSWAPSDPVCYN